jgi:hypothetical protein
MKLTINFKDPKPTTDIEIATTLETIAQCVREGGLFVHGSYDAIKEVQRRLFDCEKHDSEIAAQAAKDEKKRVLDAVFNGVSCLAGSPEEANEEQCMKRECSLAMTYVGCYGGNPLDTRVMFDGCLIEHLRNKEP